MKIYSGYRLRDGRCLMALPAVVLVHEPGQNPRPLDLRHHLRRHSEEFNWGYGGSGPAQLALALVADALGDDERALDVYQGVKFKLVAILPEDGWAVTEELVKDVVARVETLRKERR